MNAQLAVGIQALRLSYPRLLMALAVLALVVGGWSVDVWLVMALGLWAAAALAVRRSFRRLRLHVRLEGGHAFAREWLHVRVTLANPGRWPLPWLEVATDQPAGLAGGSRHATWLPGGAVRTLEWRWYAQRRGLYRLGAARLRGGDWFGLQRAERLVHAALEVVVFPRVLAVPRNIDQALLPEGPRREPLSPFADDLPIGLRAYRAGDPLRRIAWRASAHCGEWLVGDLPPVRERARTILLDLRRADWGGRAGEYLVEDAISLAASLAWDRACADRPVGLGTWAATRVRDVHLQTKETDPALFWAAPHAGQRARAVLLRALALAEAADAPPFTQVLRALLPVVPWGSQCIWVVPTDRPELREAALLWQRRGRPVLMLCLDRRTGAPRAEAGGYTLRVGEVRVHADAFAFA